MFTPYQVFELGIAFVMMLIAVWTMTTSTQRSVKAEIRKTIDEVKAEQGKLTAAYNAQALAINSILVGDIHELREKQKLQEERLREIETGRAEWIRTLRKRSHGLANDLHATILDLELVKQGKRTNPRRPRSLHEMDSEDLPHDD